MISFLMVGCAPRPAPVTVEQARRMETREFYATSNQVLKASISALQDLRYTIDVADADLGIIVASLRTQGEQTTFTDEPDMVEDEMSTGKKILIGATIIAIVVGFFAIFSGGGDNDDDDYDNGRHRGGGWGWGFGHNDDDDGPTVYEYKLNINVQSLDSTSTQIRVSANGRAVSGRSTKQAGAIEDPLFFDRFFQALEESLVVD